MNEKHKKIYKNFLFNFSSSYSGGGLKRLLAFSDWFNEKGGANFIVHENLKGKLDSFSFNNYHYINISKVKKLFNYRKYIDDILEEMDICDFYYSYNIPTKNTAAKKSWFHLSNVLPFTHMSEFNIPLKRKIELWWLGALTKESLKDFDYISAESRFSLKLLDLDSKKKCQVSPNGSDEEIETISNFINKDIEKNYAVIIGTYHHKNLMDSYKIFKYLLSHNIGLKLIIFGEKETIPYQIKKDVNVKLYGVTEHKDVLKFLANCKFYINTSMIENSWNAAAEGIFLAKESYISKIPPHNELLNNMKTSTSKTLDIFDKVMHVSRDNLKISKLVTWEKIIKDIIRFSDYRHEG